MKSESRRLGVRVRLMLNRYEAREAARAAMGWHLSSAEFSERARLAAESALAMPKGKLEIYIGRGKGAGTIGVPCSLFEAACRKAAGEAGHQVPDVASLRVSHDPEGQISGATFQFWILEEGEADGL